MIFHVDSPTYGIIKVIIDDEDFEKVNKYTWHVSVTNNLIYIHANIKLNNKWTCISLHRLLMDSPVGKEIDHIDGDPLNNKKDNLRICTHAENIRNMKKPKSGLTSKYKGVRKLKRNKYKEDKFTAQIFYNGKSIYLGSFKTEIEAAEAYNKAADKYFCGFGNLNYIG